MSQSQSSTTSLSQRHRFRAPFKQASVCTDSSTVNRDILDCVVSQNNKHLYPNTETRKSTDTIEGSQLNSGQCGGDRCKFLEHVELFPTTNFAKNYNKKRHKRTTGYQRTISTKPASTYKRIRKEDVTVEIERKKSKSATKSMKEKCTKPKKHKETRPTLCNKSLPTKALPQKTCSNPINAIIETNASSTADQSNICEKSLSSTHADKQGRKSSMEPASGEHRMSSTAINQSGQRQMRCSLNKTNKFREQTPPKVKHNNQQKSVNWSTTPSTTPTYQKRRLYNPNSSVQYEGSPHQTIVTGESTEHGTVKQSSVVTGGVDVMTNKTQVTAQKAGNKTHWPNIEHEFLSAETKTKELQTVKANSTKTRAKRMAELEVLRVIGRMREEIRCLRLRQKELWYKMEMENMPETFSCVHPLIRAPVLRVEVTSADRKGRRTLQIKQSGSKALGKIGAGYGLLPTGQLLGNEF